MKNLSLRFLFPGLLCIPLLSGAVEIGGSAPQCPLASFTDSAPIDLEAYRGKVVYLDFWASWCGPCLQSMPYLDELQKQLGPKGLQVLAVNLDDDRADADAFLKKHPVSLSLAAAPDGQCPKQFGVETMPTSYLIDRKGKIRHVQLGFRKGEGAEIRKRIEQLLAEG